MALLLAACSAANGGESPTVVTAGTAGIEVPAALKVVGVLRFRQGVCAANYGAVSSGNWLAVGLVDAPSDMGQCEPASAQLRQTRVELVNLATLKINEFKEVESANSIRSYQLVADGHGTYLSWVEARSAPADSCQAGLYGCLVWGLYARPVTGGRTITLARSARSVPGETEPQPQTDGHSLAWQSGTSWPSTPSRPDTISWWSPPAQETNSVQIRQRTLAMALTGNISISATQVFDTTYPSWSTGAVSLVSVSRSSQEVDFRTLPLHTGLLKVHGSAFIFDRGRFDGHGQYLGSEVYVASLGSGGRGDLLFSKDIDGSLYPYWLDDDHVFIRDQGQRFRIFELRKKRFLGLIPSDPFYVVHATAGLISSVVYRNGQLQILLSRVK